MISPELSALVDNFGASLAFCTIPERAGEFAKARAALTSAHAELDVAKATIERLTCDLSRAHSQLSEMERLREALGKYETVMHYARRWREVVDANNNHPKVRDLVSAIDGDALKGKKND